MVISSAISLISAILCEIYIRDTPFSFNSLIILNNPLTSFSVSDDVGSSKMMIFAPIETAFAISTDCICDIDNVCNNALGFTLSFTSFSHLVASFSIFLWSITFRGPIFIVGYLPKNIFSAIDLAGTGCNS